MERGKGQSSNDQKIQNRKTNTRPSNALMLSNAVNSSSSSSSSNNNNNDNIQRSSTRTVSQQEHFLPIANIIRIMRRILPPNAKISDEAKETIQQCVSEYINFITAEANLKCHDEQRKTINAEDVLWAMSRLGFDDYIQPLTLYLNRYRQNESQRNSVRGEPYIRRTVEYPDSYSIPTPAPSSYVPPTFPLRYPQGFSHPAMMNNVLYNRTVEGDNNTGSGSSSNNQPTLPDPKFK